MVERVSDSGLWVMGELRRVSTLTLVSASVHAVGCSLAPDNGREVRETGDHAAFWSTKLVSQKRAWERVSYWNELGRNVRISCLRCGGLQERDV